MTTEIWVVLITGIFSVVVAIITKIENKNKGITQNKGKIKELKQKVDKSKNNKDEAFDLLAMTGIEIALHKEYSEADLIEMRDDARKKKEEYLDASLELTNSIESLI